MGRNVEEYSMESDIPYELAAALQGLLSQTYQMRDMFPDEDRAIAGAVRDAEAALRLYKKAAASARR